MLHGSSPYHIRLINILIILLLRFLVVIVILYFVLITKINLISNHLCVCLSDAVHNIMFVCLSQNGKTYISGHAIFNENEFHYGTYANLFMQNNQVDCNLSSPGILLNVLSIVVGSSPLLSVVPNLTNQLSVHSTCFL